MSQLGLIVKNEYLTSIRAKSFWISTFVVPLLMVAFGAFAGYMAANSESAMEIQESMPFQPDSEEMTALKAVGMMMGLFLTLFIMMYGTAIFTKVKAEKTNRIVEIMATCVPGRTMMLAKILAVGLTGLTQLLLWAGLIIVMVWGILIVVQFSLPWDKILQFKFIMAVVWSILYFLGGYVFFGSMYASGGAISDKNNENQEYVSILTFILLISFYVGMYAVDHGNTVFVRILAYIPFTSPTVGAINAITGASPIWETLISIAVLYFCAWLSMAFAGKIYTSSLLMKGKKFTLKDIVTFFKAK